LVGDRRVEVTILNDYLATLQCGTHQRGNVVGSIRGIEQSFCSWINVPAVMEYEVAHLNTHICATRFTSAHNSVALFSQPLSEKTCLGGLTRTVSTLEGDEQPGHELLACL
jgi:hypothetical protein